MERTNTTPVPAKEKASPKAFVNWTTQIDDVVIRSSKGFPIMQNPEYPNKQEDLLVELAKRHMATEGKALELTMTVSVYPNTPKDEYDIDTLLAKLGHTAQAA